MMLCNLGRHGSLTKCWPAPTSRHSLLSLLTMTCCMRHKLKDGHRRTRTCTPETSPCCSAARDNAATARERESSRGRRLQGCGPGHWRIKRLAPVTEQQSANAGRSWRHTGPRRFMSSCETGWAEARRLVRQSQPSTHSPVTHGAISCGHEGHCTIQDLTLIFPSVATRLT